MAAWPNIDHFLDMRRIRRGPPTLGQTTGGRHAPGSLHYAGLARDYGRSNSDCAGIFQALLPYARGGNYTMHELYYSGSGGGFYKRGVAISPSFGLRASHYSHVHAGLRAGAYLPVGGLEPPKPLGGILKDGDLITSGPRVEEWQRKMNAYLNSGITVDSYFGPATYAVTKAFQNFFKLGADGKVGKRTKDMMQYFIDSRGGVQHDGRLYREGKHVTDWQHPLHFYGGALDLRVTGRWDWLTFEGTVNLQRLFHLDADGTVGRRTRKVMNDLIARKR